MTEDENQISGNEQNSESQPEPTPAEQLKARLYKDPNFLKTIISAGHSLTDHVGKTPEETLNRTIKNIKSQKRSFSSSTFDTEESYYRYVPQAIAYHAEDIVKWLQEPTTEPLELLYPTEDEIIGFGFEFKNKKPSIFEYTSNNCFLFLTKREKDDGEDYTINDIVITTAYPMINNDLGKQQNTDLRPIIKKTPAYHASDPIKQVWFEYIANNPELAVFYLKNDPKLEIRIVDDKGKNLIHIGTTPEAYTVSAQDPTTDTELTQAIRDTKEFPENQLIFIIHGTVHDLMKNMHPAEVAWADALFQSIQEKVMTNPSPKKEQAQTAHDHTSDEDDRNASPPAPTPTPERADKAAAQQAEQPKVTQTSSRTQNNQELKRKAKQKGKKKLKPVSEPKDHADKNKQEDGPQDKAPKQRRADKPGPRPTATPKNTAQNPEKNQTGQEKQGQQAPPSYPTQQEQIEATKARLRQKGLISQDEPDTQQPILPEKDDPSNPYSQ